MMEKVFGQILTDLMDEKGIDTRKLSSLVNVKYSTVNMWRNGRVIPLAKTLTVLADYFNVSVDYLLGRTDNMFVKIGNAEIIMSAEEKARFLKLRNLNDKELKDVDEFIEFKLGRKEK